MGTKWPLKNKTKQNGGFFFFCTSTHIYILEGRELWGNVGSSATADSYFCVSVIGKQEVCESIKPRPTHPDESLIGHYNNFERRFSSAEGTPSFGSSSFPFVPPLLTPPLLTSTGSNQLAPAWSIFAALVSFFQQWQLLCSSSAKNEARLFALTACAVNPQSEMHYSISFNAY